MIYSSITLICIGAWAAPGPNMLAILDATGQRGLKVGLFTGLGMAFAAFFWTLLAAWGSAEVFERWPQLTLSLRIIGSCYLLYLAWNTLRHKKQQTTALTNSTANPVQSSYATSRCEVLLCRRATQKPQRFLAAFSRPFYQ